MSGGLVSDRVEGGIAVLEMKDPPANTYTYEMMRELDDAILRARLDENVHLLVVTGAGEEYFSAGANLEAIASASPEARYCHCLHAGETLNRLEQTAKLVIAALNGHALAGGLEIALACDLRIARQGGGRIGLPEVTLGLPPAMGGTQRLGRMLGKSRAIELMATGRTIEFEEALELGIINSIYESDNFMPRVMDYARQFCPPNKASRVVGAIKRSVCSGVEIPFSQGLALERELQQQLLRSDDAREGLDAHVEKRPPQFKGK